MSSTPREARPCAVLVSVQLPGVSDDDHRGSIAELGRLVHTLGYEVVGTVAQKRASLSKGGVLGEGKLKELSWWTGGTGEIPSSAPERKDKARAKRAGDADETDDGESAFEDDDGDFEEDETPDEGDVAEVPGTGAPKQKATLVVVDHELTPNQTRNLERATGADVLDRTGVIVEIFHRHAQSREARLQVEIARLNYVAPRMRESGGGDRQRGGIGGKGAGESALELDRRKVRDRIAELRHELAAIEKEQSHRRRRRSEQARVALVGYTNAGKSSLMRALTGSEVLVADKLFATLDTTVRALHPEVRPRILVSDTVGFIKKLPHDLVASFRSTLDEALEASLLLYVVDASDPTFRSQLEVTRGVLAEIGANDVPSRLVLNKMDRVDAVTAVALAAEFPDAIQLSAHRPEDIVRLHDEIVAWFEHHMIESELIVPYGRQGVIGEVHERSRVLDEQYDERGAVFRIKATEDALARLKALVADR